MHDPTTGGTIIIVARDDDPPPTTTMMILPNNDCDPNPHHMEVSHPLPKFVVLGDLPIDPP
jgi:hypothetical protein